MTANASRSSAKCIERYFIQRARGNISNVQVMGVEKDMIRQGHQVSVCVCGGGIGNEMEQRSV